MATSLQRQLIALAAPSSSLLAIDRKRASIIFSPDEAAKYDRETFYQIGREGLKELEEINLSLFGKFSDSLIFNDASKSLERAVENKETNKRLDAVIEEFLVAISPYMMIKAPLKCMEWLVYRFHIERFNLNSIMECILPYYDTKTFALVIKVFETEKFQRHPEWLWLLPSVQTGLPVPKATLFANSNVLFVDWIFESLSAFIRVHEAHPENLATFLAFLTSTMLGILNQFNVPSKDKRKRNHKAVANAVWTRIQSLLESIKNNTLLSENENLHSSIYMIITMLIIISKENPKITPAIPACPVFNLVLRTYPPTLEKHAILLLNLVSSVGRFDQILFRKNEDSLRERIVEAIISLSEEMDIYFAARLIFKNILTSKNRPKLNTFWDWISRVQMTAHQRADFLKDLFLTLKNGNITKDRFLAGEFSVDSERKYPVEFALATDSDPEFTQLMLKEREKIDTPVNAEGLKAYRVKTLKKLLYQAKKHLGKLDAVNQKKIKNPNFPAQPFLKDTNIYARNLILRFDDDERDVTMILVKAKLKLMRQLFSTGMLINGYGFIVTKRAHPVCTRIAIKKLCQLGLKLDSVELKKQIFKLFVPFLLPMSTKELKYAKVVLSTKFARKDPFFKNFSSVITSEELTHKNLCKLSFELLTREKPELDAEFWLKEFASKRQDLMGAILAIISVRDVQGANALMDVMEKQPLGVFQPYPLNPEKIFKQIKSTLKQRKISLELLFTSLLKIDMDKEFVQRVFTLALFRAERPEHRVTCAAFMHDLMQKNFNKSSALLDFWMTMILSTRSKVQDPYKSEYLLIRSLQFLASIFEKLAGTVAPKDTFPIAKVLALEPVVEEPVVAPSPARRTRSSVMKAGTGSPELVEMPATVGTPRKGRNLRAESVESTASCSSKDRVEEYRKEASDLVEVLLTHCVQHESAAVRRWGLECIRILLQWRHLEVVWRDLIMYVLRFRIAIQSDKSQLAVAVSKLLNEKDSIKFQDRFVQIATDETKSEVIREGFTTLCAGACFNVFERLVPHIQRLLQKDPANKFLKLYLKTYDGSLKHMDVLEACLKQGASAKPILKKLTPAVFEALDLQAKKKLFSFMINASVRCEVAEVKVSIQRTVRKWLLDATIINAELENCLFLQRRQAVGGAISSSAGGAVARRNKKNVTDEATSASLDSQTPVDWVARTEAVLEFVQNGKKLSRKTKLIPPLITIIKICIELPVEYLKQLLLTALTVACEGGEGEDTNMTDWAHFEVESIIECLRYSRNPQTHHHALILLNLAAKKFPEQVRHGVMTLFTYMGSSILPQDDAYSTQLIQQTVISIIPTLVKSAETQKFPRSVVSAGIYRVFTSAVQDIPVHRRVPIFKSLVEVMDPVESMWQVCFIIVDEALMGQNKRNVLKSDLELAGNILWSFSPEIVLKTMEKMYLYLMQLPIYDKNRNGDFATCKSSQSAWSKSVIDLSRKTSLREAQLLINFTLEVIAKALIKFESLDTKSLPLEKLLENCLSFSRILSPLSGDKVFRMIANRNFEVIDKANAVLEPADFVQVVNSILEKDDHSIKKRILDIFNQRVIQRLDWFGNTSILLDLLPNLLAVGQLTQSESDQQDSEVIPLIQTAFLSLKLLSRHLALQSPDSFVPVFELSCAHARSDNKLLASSALLCLSELFVLHALIIPKLTNVTKSIQRAFRNCSEETEDEEINSDHIVKNSGDKIIDKNTGEKSEKTPAEIANTASNLLLVSGMTALNKFIEHLGTFTGTSFLTKCIVSVLSINSKAWGTGEKADNRRKTFDVKLKNLVKTVAAKIPLRNSLNSLKKAFGKLINNPEALTVILKLLRDTILATEKSDFNTLLPGLFDTFLTDLLVYRSRVEEEGISVDRVDFVEDAVIDCLVSGIVLKLSETMFRPFYHRIFDWAGESLAKKITFYRFSGYAAERLKSLFVTFAGYVIGAAAESLNENVELTKAILHYFYHIFLNDREGFVTTDRFNVLVKPLIDLMESKSVISDHISIKHLNSTIVQLAVATNDVNRWHHLMDLLVIKADHEDSKVRMFAILLYEAVANELEKDFLELLPPTVQTLSNLLGDDDEAVQKETRKMLIKLEAIVGEPLQPYFAS